MSVYTNTGDKNILNLEKQTQAIDVSTRNSYFATIVGYEAGPLNVGLFNTFMGYRAGNKTKKAKETYI